MLSKKMGLIVLLTAAMALAGWAARPQILEFKTCRQIRETPTSFQPSGWTSSFTTEDEYVYCVVKVRIPRNASRRKYDAKLIWYTPTGSVFKEDTFEDLERGYIWSLRGEMRIRGTVAASLLGEWQLKFMVSYGPQRTITFTISSPNTGPQHRAPTQGQSQLPVQSSFVKGRELEPNDTPDTANRLALNTPVQGELKYFSQKVYDQDWFMVTVPAGESLWLVINAVGETPFWVSPACFLWLYMGEDLKPPGLLHWESQQQRGEEVSTCELALQLEGAATYFIKLDVRQCRYNLAYAITVADAPPGWLKEDAGGDLNGLPLSLLSGFRL